MNIQEQSGFSPTNEVLMAPEIRRLQPEDFPGIHTILYANLSVAYAEQFGDEKSDECLREIGEYERSMEATFEHNGRTYLIAEHNGMVVGTLGYIHDSMRMREKLCSHGDFQDVVDSVDPIGELINFYVNPSMQHQGIGRRLWDGMRMTVSVGSRPSLVTLSSRDIWTGAHDFYLKQQFDKFGSGEYCGFPTTYFAKNAADF